MISEVITIAIDRVEVLQNSPLTTSFLPSFGSDSTLLQLYEQNVGICSGHAVEDFGTLEHRFQDTTECECNGGCYKCSAIFELKVKFEQSDDANEVTKNVTSRDLEPIEVVQHPDVQPVHFSSQDEKENSHDEGILIVKLARGQEVWMRCTAILGIAMVARVSLLLYARRSYSNMAAYNLLTPDEQAEVRSVCREPHL